MRIETASGLKGTLIAWSSDEEINPSGPDNGVALVKRDDAPFPERPYSTHSIYRVEWAEGTQLVAEAGHYDLALAEARDDFSRRAGLTERK